MSRRTASHRLSLPPQPQHLTTHLRESRDKVVKAVAWADGGADFLFGDGALLSFADNMNSFVAFTPTTGTEPKANTLHGRACNTTQAFSNDGDEEASPARALYSKDMLFTMWTLSRYTEKVKDALGLFNFYSVTPRLVEGLLDTPVKRWREKSAMDALILVHDRRLMERRRVIVTVSGIPTSPTAPAAAAAAAAGGGLRAPGIGLFADLTNRGDVPAAAPKEGGPRGDGGSVDGGVPSPSAASVVREVELGVEVTLWCALRRTSLTLHASGLTFAVRWPAPVAAPTRLRTSFIPTGLFFPEVCPTREGGCETEAARAEWLAAHRASSLRDALQRTQPYTLITQVFPVANPPAAWRDMLRLARQLHEETPAHECFAGPWNAPFEREESDEGDGVERDDTMYLTLPAVAEPTTRQHTCRFSRMEAAHVHYLIAGATHMESAACNDVVHGRQTKVLWRYDADPMGREPAAVYWNLDPAHMEQQGPEGSGETSRLLPWTPSTATTFADLTLRGDRSRGMPGAVLAVVREDESAALVTPSPQGYTLRHARRDGSVKAYHVSADGDVALPPSTGPLAFLSQNVRRTASSPLRQEGEGAADLPDGARRPAEPACFLVSYGDFVRALHLSRMAAADDDVSGSEVASPSSPFYRAVGSADLSAMPFLPAGFSLFNAPPPQGRYLPAVGMVATRFAQRCRGRDREARQADGAVLAGEGRYPFRGGPAHPQREMRHNGHRRAHPSMRRGEALAADATDASLFRSAFFVQGVAAPPAHAHVPDSTIFLSTRLDDVGNFTALTNGVVRCHYDDRTLLTLIPGPNEFAEEDLVAQCLFRDATRCTMRVAQCTPQHPMFRYVSFALPFRRHALAEAAEAQRVRSLLRSGVENDRVDVGEAEKENAFPRAAVRTSASLTPPMPRSAAVPTGEAEVASGVVPSSTTPPASSTPTPTTASLRASPIPHASGRPDTLETLSAHTTCRGATNATGFDASASKTALGLQVASWQDTMRERQMEHDLALQAESRRLSELLALNDSIGARNRSLLNDW